MKLRAILKSKIHRAIVTGADIDYVGSVGVDQDLLERTDIIPGERVAIWNINNGTRIDTYAISLPRGSGQIVINGAAARHFHPGDKVIIVAFCLTDEAVEPRMIAVDEQNRFVRISSPTDRPRTFQSPHAIAEGEGGETGNDEDTSHRSDCRRRHRQGSDPGGISVLNMAAEQSSFRCEFTELPWGMTTTCRPAG